MKKRVMYTLAKATTFSYLVLGASVSSFASNNQNSVPATHSAQHAVSNGGSELQSALATNEQKSQFIFVSKKLNELQMPKELALIPVIESQYHDNAVSPKGAGGLWQLMPATAKQLGISSKDRFQLEPSTLAALHYFNDLHKEFGNWEFAIAAYNAGDGRVQKALKQNPSATSVQQLNLPRETKQYVQKFYQMQGELKSYSL